MSTFFEDIKFVRPTVLMVIPRIANMIYDQMQRVISQSDIKQVSRMDVVMISIQVLKSFIMLTMPWETFPPPPFPYLKWRHESSAWEVIRLSVCKCIDGLLRLFELCSFYGFMLTSRILFGVQNALQRFREETLGGRLLFGATGTAPSAPEVIDFLSGALLIPIFESYGSTEAGGPIEVRHKRF